MRRVSELVGKPIVTLDTGEKVGHAADLLVDSSGDHLVGIVIGGGVLSGERVLPYDHVQALGEDTIVARTQHGTLGAREWRDHDRDASRSSTLKGRRVVTRDGRQIGTVHDVYIDPDTGHVEGYEVRERVFAGLVSRPRVLPRSGDVTIGPDVVIVSSEAAAQLEAQPADGHRNVLESHHGNR